MRKILFKHKTGNRGSSLVIVLIAIAFVSILTAIILSAAATNYRLKVMNNKSKKTFYSAETALEEIYAGLGEVTCDTMEVAYLDVAQNLTEKVIVGGNEYTVKINNEEANRRLKSKYYNALHNLVFTHQGNDDLDEYLTSFLSNPTNAFVTGYGNITYDEEHCSIIIEDVVVQYKQSKDSYFSTVATDIEFKYPDTEFDFISNTKSTLETFLQYGIIAMDGINVGKGTLLSKGTLAGGFFAGNQSGNGGITVDNNSLLVVGNNILDSTVISAGDVNVLDHATANFNQGKLWCMNINVGSDIADNASLTFGDDTVVYAADDLNIQGNKCTVSLGPDYSGYGYNKSYKDGLSSAIVVNGKKSVIRANGLRRLVLAGRAYIDLEHGEDDRYMTADSISLRGNQEIYLVPLYYMDRVDGSTINVTNPIPAADIVNLNIKLEDFWAYELLEQDPLAGGPFRSYNLDGVVYFYLNFDSVQNQQKYVKAILSEDYLKNNIAAYATADEATKVRWLQDRSELFALITNSMNKFVFTSEGNGISISYAADAKIYASGNLYQISGSMSSTEGVVNAGSLIDEAQLKMYCQDKSNRYSILQSFLADVGNDANDTAVATWPTEIAIAGIKYSTGDVTTTTIYDRLIDTDLLSSATENYVSEKTGGTIAAVIVEGNYTVPEYIKGGVILAYNCDVTVKSSFEGLIITNRKVYTCTGSGDVITNGIRDVASRILDEDVRISKYFYAYQMDTENVQSSSIVQVQDLLVFNNWRKNYAD
ncbi:MAG: hypothetical protein ACI4EN_00170 [Butyrivibrio sp.]